MNLIQLVYFETLAETEHLLKTAELLHVSASTVSVSIKNLEDELGVQLFDRVKRNIKLNESGRLFLPYIKYALNSIETGRQILQRKQKESGCTVKMSIKNMFNMSSIFAECIQQYPNITLNIIEGDPDDDGNLIFENDLDYMITAKNLLPNEQLDRRIAANPRIVVVVSADHPLAERKRCTLAELQNECMICRETGNYFQMQVDSILKANHFEPRSRMQADAASIPVLATSNIGFAATTELGANNPLCSDLKMLYVDGLSDHFYTTYVYWRKNCPPSKLALGALDTIIEKINQNLEEYSHYEC